MSLDQVVFLTELLAAGAVILQTIELLSLKTEYGPGGLWDWQILKDELPQWGGIFRERPFTLFLVLRLAFALVLPWVHFGLIPLFLVLGTVVISVRWRGTYNGGSDFMLFQVLLSVSIARVLQGSPQVVLMALGYVAVQCTLSYFLAGLAKLRQSSWRTGQAFSHLLVSPAYSIPSLTRELSVRPLLCFIFAWLTMSFELSSPLIFLLGEKFCSVFVIMAVLFHLANTYLLGLNHFFWTWLAAYPALCYFCRH